MNNQCKCIWNQNLELMCFAPGKEAFRYTNKVIVLDMTLVENKMSIRNSLILMGLFIVVLTNAQSCQNQMMYISSRFTQVQIALTT